MKSTLLDYQTTITGQNSDVKAQYKSGVIASNKCGAPNSYGTNQNFALHKVAYCKANCGAKINVLLNVKAEKEKRTLFQLNSKKR